ncbi:hypothetical protein CPB83DRAFT_831938 [Crepidotus variabilis]|uniref:Uncharacterized protein n=1 Tax=Crepidotus variabilis TaxID=179855 RepID=A0A9P6ERN3_9AGAR|nr:hypothetical protein CPB83DRAFT_831938 [Crepidotus variabilis]
MNHFLAFMNFRSLIGQLRYETKSLFKGLPQPQDLTDVHIATVCRTALENPWIAPDDFSTSEDNDYYEVEHSGSAWLEKLAIQETSLKAFAVAICNLIPFGNSIAPQHTNASRIQHTLGFQYARECYSACSKYTNGNIIILPEFGMADGRLYLFIPSKNWEIEIFHDGDRLEDHYGRFRPTGDCGKWISGGNMKDFIMLDFCEIKVSKTHPNIHNLCHVVVKTDHRKVSVVGNLLHTVEEFAMRD